jgi:hypothetical protein
VPTYAILDTVGRKEFSSGQRNTIQELGKKLYPQGYYYVLRFRQEHRKQVLDRLGLWMKLEDESRDRRRPEVRPTYGTLYERFRSALASSQWETAEQIRQQLTDANLTSADNLLFLEIEQLAQQQRWSDISNHKDFFLLVRMQIPRAVRAALLTAFHQAYLLKDEQQGEWLKALESFQNNQPKLGQLLTARLLIKRDPVLRVYAYQAALEHNRAALLTLQKESENPETQECIKQLLLLPGLQGAETPLSEQTLSAQALAIDALLQHDYDAALLHTTNMPEGIEKTGLLLQIAYNTSDAPVAEDALLAYWDLPTAQQNDLQQRFPSLGDILDRLQQLIDVDDTTKEQFTIADWIAWFERVQQEPDDPELIYSIPRLDAVTDERYWTVERILQLEKHLMQIIVEARIVQAPHVRDALWKLVDFFVREEAFPRMESAYQQLYETLYVALLEKPAKEELRASAIILRLADALLRNAPDKYYTVFRNLKDWSGDSPPIPKLEPWALEAFEMLIDYGLQPAQLIEWYTSWVSYLLSIRTQHERTNLEGWRLLGDVIQPGQNLLDQLDRVLQETVQQEISKPIEDLPPDFRIAIYTLQAVAAERAKKLLLARNARLDIRICADEVLSKSAKINAQNAKLVVLVTTAMKHALFYGISSYLNPERVVYSESSGSTSIIRAIEKFAMRSANT